MVRFMTTLFAAVVAATAAPISLAEGPPGHFLGNYGRCVSKYAQVLGGAAVEPFVSFAGPMTFVPLPANRINIPAGQVDKNAVMITCGTEFVP